MVVGLAGIFAALADLTRYAISLAIQLIIDDLPT
jgi:hypothetical protein